MQVSKNFIIQEFVSPDVFAQFGDKAIWFIDPKVVSIAQWLRDHTGKVVTINNWHAGGQYKESGLRSFLTSTGAQFSQHKFGRAGDMKIEGLNGTEMRKIVDDNAEKLMQLGLTTVELDTPTWLHVDCRYTGLTSILKVPFK
jgi:hypothetical protein